MKVVYQMIHSEKFDNFEEYVKRGKIHYGELPKDDSCLIIVDYDELVKYACEHKLHGVKVSEKTFGGFKYLDYYDYCGQHTISIKNFKQFSISDIYEEVKELSFDTLKRDLLAEEFMDWLKDHNFFDKCIISL